MIRPRDRIERESCLEILAEILDPDTRVGERRQVHDTYVIRLRTAAEITRPSPIARAQLNALAVLRLRASFGGGC